MDTQNPTDGHNGQHQDGRGLAIRSISIAHAGPEPALRQKVTSPHAGDVGVGQQVMLVHQELSKLAATERDAALLTLAVLRPSVPSREVVRWPVCIEVGVNADLRMLRDLLPHLVGADLTVPPGSQGKTLELMRRVHGAMMMDMTLGSEKSQAAILQEARARAVAGRRGVQDDHGARIEMYGDTFLLLADRMGGTRHSGITVRVDRSPDSLGNLAIVNKARADLAEWMGKQPFPLQEVDLPALRHVGRTERQAYLMLAALARLCDAQFPAGRFLEAVISAWKEMGEHAFDGLTMDEKIPYLCRTLLDFDDLARRLADRDEMDRLDALTRFIKNADPELFKETSERQLSALIRKYRLMKSGGFKRKRFENQPGAGSSSVPWVQLTCVALDWDRIRSLAAPQDELVQEGL